MGNKSLHKRKFDRTWDDTRQNEQSKEHYWRKKREHTNIEEINDDNVNRYFQQEVQPGMHAHMMIEHKTHIGTIFKKYRIQSIKFKFKIL